MLVSYWNLPVKNREVSNVLHVLLNPTTLITNLLLYIHLNKHNEV